MSINLTTARDALATALGGISGLRVFSFVPDSISPPAAIVTLESMTYDHTMRRGADRASFKVFVCVGKVYDRAASVALDGYLNGSGTTTTAVKAALDAIGPAVRVEAGVVQTVTLAAQEFLAGVFDIDYVA